MMVKVMKEREESLRTESLEKCHENGVTDARFVSRFGNPGEEIVQTSIDENCDLIIVGSRGLGVVRRTIMGSVSDYVLHHANVPVTVCTRHQY